MGGKEEKNELR